MVSGTFSADAVIKRNQSSTFTASAVIKRTQTGLTTTTFFDEKTSGQINARTANNANYTNVRAGTVGFQSPSTPYLAQQFQGGSGYDAQEAFLGFDTSPIPDSAIITSATLRVVQVITGYGGGAPAQNLEIRVYDYGGTVTNADYVPGDSLASLTLAGTSPSSSWTGSGATITIPISTSTVSPTGVSRFVLTPERFRTANPPNIGGANSEQFVFQTYLAGHAGGTDPQLIVIYYAFGLIQADAIIKKIQQSSFSVDAVIASAVTTVTGSFTADATFRLDNAFTANAVIRPRITLDAVIKTTSFRPGSFKVDATFASRRFRLDAAIRSAGASSFKVDAYIVSTTWVDVRPDHVNRAVTPAYVKTTARVSIWVDGVDITGHVEWATAEFTAKVNGALGECHFTVLDREHSLSFTFGQEIQLYIDDVLRWGGWILRPQRTFALSVMPNVATSPRIWQIEGVDYSRIFDMRVIHDLDHPDKAWNYAPGTHDDTVINNAWSYFDMAGFSKDIDRVAVAVLDLPGVTGKGDGLVASSGFTLREVLTSVTRNTAAIFYCSPDKVIHYLDSDRVNSVYTLTDQPSANYDVPYREAKIRADASEMCNDAIVWGAGYGTDDVVVSRHRSSSSISTYGRWQKGNFTAGVYKQATVDAIAASYVEGSPEAHRAQKLPKRQVQLVTWSTALMLGDVVNIHNSSFDYDDVLPVRQMTITFPTPYNPRFALGMSWEIDADWSMVDPWRPSGRGPIPGTTGTGGGYPPEPGDCDCANTDDFSGRVLSTSWGTSISGLDWRSDPFAAGGTVSVNGDEGIISLTDETQPRRMLLGGSGSTPFQSPLNLAVRSIRFRLPDWVSTLNSFLRIGWEPTDHPGLTNGPSIGVGFIDSGAGTNSFIDFTTVWTGGSTTIPASFWNSSSTYTWTVAPAVSGMSTSISDGIHTYSSISTSTPTVNQCAVFFGLGNSLTPDNRLVLLDIDIPGVTRCDLVQFDNFQRSATSSWGTTTPSGYTYDPFFLTSGVTAGVDSSGGWVTMDSGSGLVVHNDNPGPWTSTSGFDTIVRFGVSSVPSSGYLYLYFGDDPGNNFVEALISTDSGDGSIAVVGGSYESVVKTDWTTGMWNMRWQYAPGGASRLRVWPDGSTEPSTWDAETTGVPDFGTVLEMDLDNNTADDGLTITVRSIDFDYADRPCYLDCSDAGIDTFEGRTSSGGWGTASSGLAWVGGLGGGGVTAAVNSGYGHFGGGTTGSAADVRQFISDATAVSAFASDFDFTEIIRFNDGPTATSGDYVQYTIGYSDEDEMWWRLVGSSDYAKIGWWHAVIVEWRTDIQRIGVTTDIGDQDTVDSTVVWSNVSITDSVDYSVRWKREGMSVMARFWPAADPEPGTWDVTGTVTADFPLPLLDLIALYSRLGTPAVAQSFSTAEIQPGGCETFGPGLGTGTTGVGVSVCETMSAHATAPPYPGSSYPAGAMWSVGTSYVPGSTKVAFDGVFRFGQDGYVETDPELGQITIDDPVLTTTVVTLCYISNGVIRDV